LAALDVQNKRYYLNRKLQVAAFECFIDQLQNIFPIKSPTCENVGILSDYWGPAV